MKYELGTKPIVSSVVFYNIHIQGVSKTEKSTQILKIFSNIAINTNCLLLSLSSYQAENIS